MKHSALLIILVMIHFLGFSQENSGYLCEVARPFCSGTAYLFPNSTGTTAQAGPNYGCLSTRPNPIWYFMEIDEPGGIQLSLRQSTQSNGSGAIDVDFAMWGPFESVGHGCSRVIIDRVAPIQCSYSTSATETIGLGFAGGTAGGASTPPAGQRGEIYLLLLTNYSGREGFISLTQTGGTGSTNCDIVDLALELHSFEGKKVGNETHLNWKMESQHNIESLEVQRAGENSIWSTVGNINIDQTLKNQSYSFKDIPSSKTKVYYRIAMVGFDGRRHYSDIVFINHEKGNVQVQAIFNEMGLPVESDYRGLKIYQYVDGTFERVYTY